MKSCSLFLLAVFSFLCTCCDTQPESEQLQIAVYNVQPELDRHLNLDSEYIVVIGDIQEYTHYREYNVYYAETMSWIYSQYHLGAKIKCVLQVGDLTMNNLPAQYDTFYKYTYPVAALLPYIACIGNHDYTWNADAEIVDRNNTLFSQYVSFNSTEKKIVHRFEEGKMENIVVEINIDGSPVYFLVLEFGARSEVVEWAADYVRKNKDKKFILLTHEFLSSAGERIASNSFAERQIRNSSWSSPEDIWVKLVKNNDNIVCVLCGHNGFSQQLYSKNDSGRMVPQILFNLQYQSNGGDGLVQLWEFPCGKDSVNVEIYNTRWMEPFVDSNVGSFSFQFIR